MNMYDAVIHPQETRIKPGDLTLFKDRGFVKLLGGVSTNNATKDLILRSSNAAKCFAFTAAEANAAAAAVCTFTSLNICLDSVSFKVSPSIPPSPLTSIDVVPPDISLL
uniref:Uncharacterized protein n=1 Tax=Glossina austeni TaxID=7395 RepID=A0A1A9VDI2_GLOAU